MLRLMLEFIRDELCGLVLFHLNQQVGRGCGMQSFISPVDHYTALLCHLLGAQWVFEQVLGTLKAALLRSECLLTSRFVPRARLHSLLMTLQQHRQDSQIVFLRLCTRAFTLARY